MKFNISTFQKINIIAILFSIIAFFIPILIDTSYQTRLYYIIEIKFFPNLSLFSLIICGLLAAILNTIMSFKGMSDICMQYLAGILLTIAPILFLFYIYQVHLYELFLGYAPFLFLISGILLIANSSKEIKNYNREELIAPHGIILASIWNLLIRNIIPLVFFVFIFFVDIYFFLVLIIIRNVLDILLIFGARSVFNRLKIGAYICLISIIPMIIIDVWFFILISKNSVSLTVWLLLLGIPLLMQLNGSVKSFRESLEL